MKESSIEKDSHSVPPRNADLPTYKKSSFTLTSLSVFAGIFIPVYVTLVYFTGAFYYSGFLDGFNIEPGLFPLPKEEILVRGGLIHLSIYGDLIVPCFKFLSIAAPIVAITMVISLWVLFKKRKAQNLNDLEPDFIKIRIAIKQSLPELRTTAFILGLILFIPFLILAPVASLAHARNVGKKEAANTLNAIQANTMKQTTITRQFGKELKAEGYLITCSEKMCALYNKGNLEVVHLEQAVSITTHP